MFINQIIRSNLKSYKVKICCKKENSNNTFNLVGAKSKNKKMRKTN